MCPPSSKKLTTPVVATHKIHFNLTKSDHHKCSFFLHKEYVSESCYKHIELSQHIEDRNQRRESNIEPKKISSKTLVLILISESNKYIICTYFYLKGRWLNLMQQGYIRSLFAFRNFHAISHWYNR